MKKIITIISVIALFWACESTGGKSELKISSAENVYVPSESPNMPGNTEDLNDNFNSILIGSVEELNNIEKLTSGGNLTVSIKDGTYVIDRPLIISADNVTLKSESGSRENVIITGGIGRKKSSIDSVLRITGNNFKIKNISIGGSADRGVELSGEDRIADNFTAFNVCFFDINENMIEASWDSLRPADHSDYGAVEYCLFENTAGNVLKKQGAGINVQRGMNWRIKGNTFKNLACSDSSKAWAAAAFYNHSDGTVIKNNVILNCDRGIVLGLEGSPHYNGIIMNNSIHVISFAGINLRESVNTQVYNNTVYRDGDSGEAIECCFNCDGSRIINNLTNSRISFMHGNGVYAANNFDKADISYFRNVKKGDFHLRPKASGAINMGTKIAAVPEDMDFEPRSDAVYDIGADEAF